MHINDGGVLRRVRAAYVNDGGTLRRIRQIYVNDGGVLRRENFESMPAFVDAGAGAFGSVSPFNIPFPSGITAGQFLVVQVYNVDSTAPAVTTPAGWTSAGAFPGGAVVCKQWLFWRVADGSETGNLSVSFTSDTTCAGRMYRFSNGSGVEAAAGAMNTSGATTMPAVDVTTLGPNRLAAQLNGATVNSTIGDMSGESGADYTEAVAEYTTAAPVLLQLQTAQVAAASAITGGSSTLGASGSFRARYGFAIVP